MDWHSIHVHYYSDDKDPLLLYGVRALFEALRPVAPRAFFLRHWRQGPHLRLNLYCPEHVFAEAVPPIVKSTVGRYLDERPSAVVIDPMERLPMHRRLAELESDPGPLLPWYPDNSIRYTSFDRGRPMLLGPDAEDLLIDFYVDTGDLVFDMLEGITRGRARYRLAFDLMISTAHVLSGVGLSRGGISFRSHAEAFLHGYAEGRGMLERWDEHYAANSATLVDRVAAVVTRLDGGDPAGDGGGEPVPHVREWIAALVPYQRRARDLLAAGLVSARSDDRADGRSDDRADGRAGQASAAARLGSTSAFHRALFASAAWEEMRESDWFLCYRMMLNFTYLHLNRLGITPVERFLLCHLAANAVEDHFGVSALDLVGAAAGSGGEQP